MVTPPLSIVIVNWKTPHLLASCLDSIEEEDNSKRFEIWVVDNASNDGSVSMIQAKYPYVNVIANRENLGFSKACNQAIPQTSGQFILLLNPDTTVTQGAINKLLKFLAENPDCGAAGPKILNPDGTLQLACRRAFPSVAASFFRVTYLSRLFPKNQLFSRYNLSYIDPDRQLSVDALSGSCMMVRRQVIDQVGLLDEEIFMFGEDIDWCWRIKQAGWSVFYLPDAVVYHIHGAASRLRPIGTTVDLHKGMAVFYRKHLAQNQPIVINLIVYTAIWSRALLFVIINFIRALFRTETSIMETLPANRGKPSAKAGVGTS